MNGCNDYTNMKRMQQIIKPCYNYDSNRCDQNKINYVYVVPHNEQIGYDNNCIIERPPFHCPSPGPVCTIGGPDCPPGPAGPPGKTGPSGPAGPAGQGGDKLITNSMRICKIYPVQGQSVTIKGEPGLSYSRGTDIICTDISNNDTYFFGEIDYCGADGEIEIGKIDNIVGKYGESSVYSVSILPGRKELLKLRAEMNYLYEIILRIDLYPNKLNEVILIQDNNYVNMLFNYLFDVNLIDYYSGYKISESHINFAINKVYLDLFNVDINKNKLFNPNNNAIHLDTLNVKISQLYLYLFDNDLTVQVLFKPFK